MGEGEGGEIFLTRGEIFFVLTKKLRKTAVKNERIFWIT